MTREEYLKNKILELDAVAPKSQPYAVDIDIDPKNNYWEVGMKTKYKGKDVEILACLFNREYVRVINESSPGVLLTEDRVLQTLLIRDL